MRQSHLLQPFFKPFQLSCTLVHTHIDVHGLMWHLGMVPQYRTCPLKRRLPSAEKYLLGLCEGNFCSGGRHGRKQGNGQIVRLIHRASCWVSAHIFFCVCCVLAGAYWIYLSPDPSCQQPAGAQQVLQEGPEVRVSMAGLFAAAPCSIVVCRALIRWQHTWECCDCHIRRWEVQKVISIPKSAAFEDYRQDCNLNTYSYLGI